MKSIVAQHVHRTGLDESVTSSFLKDLERDVCDYKHDSLSRVSAACQRVWTSGRVLSDGKAFCSVLNAAIRADDEEMMAAAAGFVRGLSELCGERGEEVWPKDRVLYRGGGLPDVHQGECESIQSFYYFPF